MLELYRNIRKYRKEAHMSQEELAKKVGYTDRSSIAKIENGDVDLPQSKIMAIAKALDVSAGALMGWESSPEGTAASGTAASVSSIDSKKNWLNRLYDELEPKNKEALLTRADELYKLQQLEAGEKEIPRRSFIDSDAEGTA